MGTASLIRGTILLWSLKEDWRLRMGFRGVLLSQEELLLNRPRGLAAGLRSLCSRRRTTGFDLLCKSLSHTEWCLETFLVLDLNKSIVILLRKEDFLDSFLLALGAVLAVDSSSPPSGAGLRRIPTKHTFQIHST